jgi:hypothetical protein
MATHTRMSALLNYIQTKQPIFHGPETLPAPTPIVEKKKSRSKKQPATATAAPMPTTGKKSAKKPYKKQKISAALREQVWVQKVGRVFEAKCMVTWCKNKITVFDFQSGHDIPESKGGPTNIANLYPICGKCNLSMSNTYTFQEWCKLYHAVEEIPVPLPPLPPPRPRGLSRFFTCFGAGRQQHPIS